ncbi:hypothetical protein XHC_3964 [Xanthomonas hortorum pv. carotae str. M081]|nr:hypothetical protein XHC_3964 [Xanthomonas hortorum pv. carotae str. M081]
MLRHRAIAAGSGPNARFYRPAQANLAGGLQVVGKSL